MSTILKALRRLEEDRHSQSQRPLREEVTRGSPPTKSRRGRRPLWVALLGLVLAAGAGVLTYRYLAPASEPAEPAGSTELAAAASGKSPAEPAAPPKRPLRPRGVRRAPKRPSPSPAAAPREASEPELPDAALASEVETIKRPMAQPRIAASESAGPTGGELAPRMDPAEIPGRHKRPDERSPGSPSAPPSSSTEWAEVPPPSRGTSEPDTGGQLGSSRGGTAGPERDASRREPAATAFEGTEAGPEPPVVALVPQPERMTPQPPAPEKSASPPTESAAVVPPRPEPGESASKEIARAEIPTFRVERTVWHPLAERRIAVIEFEESAERREVHEGDAVGPLVVSGIEPSGVVFVHEGVEVRRRVGE